MRVYTDVELADELKITVEKLHDLRVRRNWPCVKLGRFEVRFTEAQVEQILAMSTQAPSRPLPKSAVAGQSPRSLARSRGVGA